MKKLTEFIPLFTGFSTALLLVAAMAQPAVAGGVAGGTKTCNSWLDGVFTFETAPVHKKCWGGLGWLPYQYKPPVPHIRELRRH